MKGSTDSSLRLTVLSFDIKQSTLFYINNIKSSTFDHVVLNHVYSFYSFQFINNVHIQTINTVCSIAQLHCHKIIKIWSTLVLS